MFDRNDPVGAMAYKMGELFAIMVDEMNREFGEARGRAAAASDLLKLACGRSREEVASNAILAVLADRPVIHRDELVLFE